MTMNKYGALVKQARENLRVTTDRRYTASASLSIENFSEAYTDFSVWARELDNVNKHISVDPSHIKKAEAAYDEIAQHLVDNLKWPRDAIQIHPQGSARTQTLINSPDASKFDIDAVCSVDISRIESYDPMHFFNEVGRALAEWDPEAKKRCWRIEFPNTRFYIEFTPSVPLGTVPAKLTEAARLKPTNAYKDTALAVVNRPTKSWNTSNPEGFANWVNEQSGKPLLVALSLEFAEALAKDANIAPVPLQEVPLSDTLRVAIRLFKRHRDMAVRRGELESDFKPISVIIVTLLTQCYQGMADNNERYNHPIELLVDMAKLFPHMIEQIDGKYWVSNPTVEGENFAERWNDVRDGEKRKKAFDSWCNLLVTNLGDILKEHDEKAIQKRVREVFGCPSDTKSDSSGSSSGSVGLAPKAPSRSIAPPASAGLA